MINLGGRATTVVGFYNQPGTAEQWVKEGTGLTPLEYRSKSQPPRRSK